MQLENLIKVLKVKWWFLTCAPKKCPYSNLSSLKMTKFKFARLEILRKLKKIAISFDGNPKHFESTRVSWTWAICQVWSHQKWKLKTFTTVCSKKFFTSLRVQTTCFFATISKALIFTTNGRDFNKFRIFCQLCHRKSLDISNPKNIPWLDNFIVFNNLRLSKRAFANMNLRIRLLSWSVNELQKCPL